MPPPHTERVIYRSGAVTVTDYRCREHAAGCGPGEHSGSDSVVFLRRGFFLKHLGRQRIVADPNNVVLFNRGEEYRVSHPLDGGDDCTVFNVDRAILLDLLRECDPAAQERPARPFAFTHCLTRPAVHLVHRAILKFIKGTAEPDLAADETILRLLDRVIGEGFRLRRGGPLRGEQRPDTQEAHHDLAAAVQAVLARRLADRLPLQELAREVHSSPFHLCRVFRRQTGQPIHQYRNRLRLRVAMERLAEDRCDSTRLALDLGYSSGGHFSDAFRREFGLGPAAFRRTLATRRLREMSKILGARPAG